MRAFTISGPLQSIRSHLPRRRWLIAGALAVVVVGTVFAAGVATGRVGPHRAQAASTLSFAAPAVYLNGLSPDQTAVGDFNGDGYPDLIETSSADTYCVQGTPTPTCTSYPSEINILLNNGDGTFRLAPGSPITLSSITTPTTDMGAGGFHHAFYAVVVGDFNRDGKLDAAVLDIGFNVVYVLLGNGDGSLQIPTAARTIVFTGSTYTGGLVPNFLGVGDFNGDGKLDLVTSNGWANATPGSVSVLRGHGDGTFTAPDSTPGPTSNNVPTGGKSEPFLVLVADFNGDGKPDMVTLNSNSYGYFCCTPPPRRGTPPASAGAPATSYSVLENNGGGGFHLVSGDPVNTANATYAMSVGDFNGDGKPDLAFANFTQLMATSSSMDILLNTGKGTFTPAATNPPIPLRSTGSLNDVEVGDFNGDGKPDLLVTTQNMVLILLGQGHGDFATPVSFPATTNYDDAYSAIIGDFNEDGLVDFATLGALPGNNYYPGQVTTVLNTSTYTLPTSTTLTTGATTVTQGDPVTLTATVHPTTVNTGRLGGSVTFKDGGSTLATVKVSGGKASYTTTALALGTHTITASYGGAGHFTASASRALTLTVGVGGEDVLGGSTSGQPATGQPATGSGNPGGATGQAGSGTPQNPPAAPSRAIAPSRPAVGSGFPVAPVAAVVVVLLLLGGGAVGWRRRPRARHQ